jgi:hypothetical protein
MDRYFGNVVSNLSTSACQWSVLGDKVLLLSVRSHFAILLGLALIYMTDIDLARLLQCELDIMFHLEKAHFMLDEMVMNGCIVETNKANVLQPIQLMDKAG